MPLILERLVPKKGLEPPHPCEYVDLNHARLPIPPLRHMSDAQAECAEQGSNIEFRKRGLRCQIWRITFLYQQIEPGRRAAQGTPVGKNVFGVFSQSIPGILTTQQLRRG